MIRFLIFIFKNRTNLSMRFFYLALYRKYKRLYMRLFIFDALDKLFLCLLFCNSLIGLYSFLVLTNPSLRLGEIFILLPCIVVYLYILLPKNLTVQFITIMFGLFVWLLFLYLIHQLLFWMDCTMKDCFYNMKIIKS